MSGQWAIHIPFTPSTIHSNHPARVLALSQNDNLQATLLALPFLDPPNSAHLHSHLRISTHQLIPRTLLKQNWSLPVVFRSQRWMCGFANTGLGFGNVGTASLQHAASNFRSGAAVTCCCRCHFWARTTTFIRVGFMTHHQGVVQTNRPQLLGHASD